MSSSCAAVRAHATVDIHSSVPLRDARQQHDRHSKGPELRAAFEQALASSGGGQLVACASPPFPLPRKHTINIFTSLPSLPSRPQTRNCRVSCGGNLAQLTFSCTA